MESSHSTSRWSTACQLPIAYATIADGYQQSSIYGPSFDAHFPCNYHLGIATNDPTPGERPQRVERPIRRYRQFRTYKPHCTKVTISV